MINQHHQNTTHRFLLLDRTLTRFLGLSQVFCLFNFIIVKKQPCPWHMQNSYHSSTSAGSLNFWQVMKRCIDQFPSSLHLRICYHEGVAKHGKLPKLSGLRIEKAVECSDYNEIFTGIYTWRNHEKKWIPVLSSFNW